MKRRALAATLLLALACATAAEAGNPPLSSSRSRADLAAACSSLGERGQGHGLDQASGPYGCRDMSTGNTVTCQSDGRCKDYSGDPRWKKIHDWLHPEKQQRVMPL